MITNTHNKTFAGIRVQQTWTALYCLENFLTAYKPDLIIELGTGCGGLSLFFSLHALTYTFDTGNRAELRRLLPYDIRFIKGDVFDPMYFQEIKILCEEYEKVFLFCDGGNKLEEFKMYAPVLHGGQVIGVHDYETEVFGKDLRPLADKADLEPVEHIVFEQYETLIRLWSKRQAVGF